MILLDTCALLWLVMDSARLSDTAKSTVRESRGAIFVSAITAFEIGQKHAAAKLVLPFSPSEWFGRACSAHGLSVIPLTSDHAFLASSLPLIHRDPFDRLLIATAQTLDIPLVTQDPLIHSYPSVRAIW